MTTSVVLSSGGTKPLLSLLQDAESINPMNKQLISLKNNFISDVYF